MGADAAIGPPGLESATAVFNTYCVKCHSGHKPKGDMDFPALLRQPDQHPDAWQDVLDQLNDGSMPPKGKPRPSVAEVRGVTQWIDQVLRAQAAVAAARDGRTRLRRLNRVEYSNTVRDLLGLDQVDLADLLPEDGSAHGFDTVDAALSISPVLIERYLAAADAALDAATVSGPAPTPKKIHWEYKSISQMPEKIKAGMFISERPDAAVLYDGRYSPYEVNEARQLPAGRYKFRISAYGVNNGDTPAIMAVYVGNFFDGGGGNHLAGYFDVAANQPTVVEIVDRLRGRGAADTLKPVPYGTPFVWRNDHTISSYHGPGIAVQWIEAEGPLVDAWPPPSHRVLYGDVLKDGGSAEQGEALIRRFLPRAFRRPVAESEVARYAGIVRTELEAGKPFIAAMRRAYKSILCSPKFLFRAEPPGKLDDFALATRLSYFLWSSCPDEQLLDAASKKELTTMPSGLGIQVERMLKDPKAQRFNEQFTGQWLSLRNIDATTPDHHLYPEFDQYLQLSMLEETRLFFNEILTSDRPLTDFVQSDWTYLNGRLAREYGIPSVQGTAFRKVQLKPEYHRGGLLTQASVLKVTANGTTTSPVTRGAWVLDRILGRPPQPPPPNVPAVEPDIRGATTIREQLAKHRTMETCASCHRRIDPAGSALESFDVIGGFRENYRITDDKANKRTMQVFGGDGENHQVTFGPPVDASDVLADGRPYKNVDEFKALLLADNDQLARALAEKLIAYSTGHSPEASDRPEVDSIVAAVRPKGYGFRSLIHEIVDSPLFRNK